MNEELKTLEIVCQKLENLGIDYYLSGSMAANNYTVPRMTRDIDIVIELTLKDIDRFFLAFKDEFYIDKQMVFEAVKNEHMFNVIYNEYVLKIDFIIRKNTEFQNSCLKRRKKIKIDGFHVYIITCEDLIISKLLWAKDTLSEMQIKDVNNLLTTSEIDNKYLEAWILKLALHDIYKRVKK
ncbi:MAG: nucleotidyltransferase [Pseudomonadota bacterium]